MAISDTQEDITLDFDSSKSRFEWEEEGLDTMKDLRISIILDVKELLNESIEEFIKNISMSVKLTIAESIPS